jgi:RHS repeat-associated protein
LKASCPVEPFLCFGAVVWQWNHDPFGNGAPMGAFTYELRFPGQFFDQATYLHYNYFRDYDPRLGRYIESDPIGLAGGINTYAYAGGNPVNGVDPLGLTAGTDSSPSREIGGMFEGIYNYFCGSREERKNALNNGKAIRSGAIKIFAVVAMWIASNGQVMSLKGV